MKTREGFVSNSSSTSFIIRNISNEQKTIVDFVIENEHLIEQFKKEYGYGDQSDLTLEVCINDAATEYFDILEAGCEDVWDFGDDDGTTLGRIYDYILRDGGKSDNFEWNFHEYNR